MSSYTVHQLFALYMIVFRDRPPTFHVQAWYDEVRDFSYPYPQECNPHCPYRCSGPVCTHYTQVKPHSRFNNLHFAMMQGIQIALLYSNSDIMFFSKLVWATTNKIGCAINVCYNMNVWGMIWTKAVYLVCNYSPP